ncbi:DUF935 domain-containing protein [Caloranaerobacter sp. DY30410]|uniref:DUF935 domain-containing protein n=1 Tax=Caloranaerobacter sp. DY30410 TaxID=3238305 RepID=UPI003D02003D
MIVDAFGRPLSSKKPIMNEIAVRSIYDKYSTYPSDGLTPQRLAAIFKEADAGDVYRQMELFEEMESKDPHLFSQLQTRKNAVIGLDFEILPYSEDERDKKIAEFVSDVIYSLESIEDIFLDLLDAIGKGFAVSEIMWAYDGKYVVIEDIKSIHQKRFLWDENNVMRLITDEEPMGIPLPQNKFVIHKYKARSGHPVRAGVLRVVAWMYLFKNYDVKDWVSFCETFGMPVRLGKYNAGTSEEEKDALMKALVTLGSDAAGIIPDSTSIEFIETNKTSSVNVYETLANFCNREMSKAILGQTLTSEIGSSGSYAASKTHDGVRQDLIEADCKALAQTFLRDVIRPLVYFNFGEVRRLPYLKFHYEPPEDLEKSAKTYAVLIKEIGLPVSEEHIYEKFGIPKPEEGQKIVNPFKTMAMKDEIVVNKDSNKVDFSISKKFQKTVDSLADEATQKSLGIFAEMYKPLKKLLDKAKSLEELKEMLNNPKIIEKLYKEMDSEELQELLQKTMFIADLLGRMREDAEHPEDN